MNKVSGLKSDFSYMREEGSRIVIGYGLEKANDDLWSWYEVYLPKKQTSQLTLQIVKDAIIADIDDRTVARITYGYEWTILHGTDEGRTVKVWLSKENQSNFQTKYNRAKTIPESVTYPVTYKISENEETKAAIYEHFADFEELENFVLGGEDYVEQQYGAGWIEKDSIDWAPYEALFPQPENQESSES